MRQIILNNKIFKYLFSIIIVFICLFIIKKIYNIKELDDSNEIFPSIIQYDDEKTVVNVLYPRFNNDNLNNIVTNIIYSYVKEFRLSDIEEKSLEINYDLYYYNEYVNIVFNINNSISNIKYKNIILNLNKNELAYISNLYDKEYLSNEIKKLVYYKYSIDIYNMVKDENINNFTYIIYDNKMVVYFNNINFNNIDYIPYITIKFDSEVTNNYDYIEGTKYIAFTYDDGPSEYTIELLNTLEANESSATFFMIGNRMKKYKDVVLDIYNSGSEIGTHTYSHKNLSLLSDEEVDEELNSANIIFNEITKDTFKYLRPPYGDYNENILDKGYKIILWNIDPKDWLNQDSKKIYNNVVKSACDGCIVLMHDVYKESIEATKMLIPKLNEMGYKIVSVSKLMEYKKFKNIKENEISYIK